jgi:hypothetical protein
VVIPYRKEIIKSDGRRLIAGGPRDQQRRISEYKDQTQIIEALRSELESLKYGIGAKGEFTGEQIDEEIRKAVTASMALWQLEAENERKEYSKEISVLKTSLAEKNNKIAELSGEIEVLKERTTSLLSAVNEKEVTITREIKRGEMLLQQLTTSGDNLIIEPSRPTMKPTFVDPLVSGSDDNLIPYIQVDDVRNDEKEEMQSKVNKLKSIMGKLPTNHD